MVTLKEFYRLLGTCSLDISVGNINAPSYAIFVGILDMAAEEGSVPDLQRKGRVAQTSRKEFRQLQIKQRITKALIAGEEVTTSNLAEEFNMGLKTVGRDIKDINEKFGVMFKVRNGSGVIYEE